MSLEYYLNEFYKTGRFDKFYEVLKKEKVYEKIDPISDVLQHYLWLFRVTYILEKQANLEEKQNLLEEIGKTESEGYLEKLGELAEESDEYDKKIVYNEMFHHYQKEDNLEKAEKILNLLEKTDPNSIQTIENRAYFEYLTGNFEKASIHYEKLSKIDERKYSLKKFLCLVKADFHNVSKVESYINHLMQNIHGNEKDCLIYELRSEIYRLTFNYKRALEAIDIAINLNPKNLRYKLAKIRILYYLKDYKTIIEEGNNLIIDENKKYLHIIAPVYFYLSVALGNVGQSDDYLNLFEKLVKRRNSEYYYEKAKKFVVEKELQKAKEYFEKSLKIDPCNVFAIQELISLEECLEDRNEQKIEELKTKNQILLERYRQASCRNEENTAFEETINLASDSNEINNNNNNNIPSLIEDALITDGSFTQNFLTKQVYNTIHIAKTTIQSYEKYNKDQWGNAIIEKIGQGGSSGVAKIFNFGDEQIQAAKYIKLKDENSDPNTMAPTYEEFKKEISLMVSLQHENIISIKGFGKGIIYMEYAKGNDIASLLKENQSLPEKFKVYVLLGIAKGIKALHEHNIVHGDIKGKNIVLNKKYVDNCETYPIPKICDFGLAGFHNEVQENSFKGTLGYIPSEYFTNKKKTNEADIFAFGMTMYELMAGEPPFAKCSKEEKIQNGKQHTLPDFEALIKEKSKNNNDTFIKDLVNIMKGCTNKEPLERSLIDDIINELDTIFHKYE